MQVTTPSTPFCTSNLFHKIHFIVTFFLLNLKNMFAEKINLSKRREKDYSKQNQLKSWFRLQTRS